MNTKNGNNVFLYEETGIEAIDRENQTVMRLLERLGECLEKSRSEEYRVCLQKLVVEFESLFREEELWMDANNFPGYAARGKICRKMLTELSAAVGSLSVPHGVHRRRIADFISKWFRNHLRTTTESIREHAAILRLSKKGLCLFEMEPYRFQLPSVRTKQCVMRMER